MRKRQPETGRATTRTRAPISAESLKRATADLQDAILQRDSLEVIARELARGSADSDGRAARSLLARSLTLRDQKASPLFTRGGSVEQIVKEVEARRLPRVYVPDAPGSPAPAINRYGLEWVSPDPAVTPGIGPVLNQFRDASKAVGYIGVANAIPPSAALAGSTHGYAQAAIGIVYRPRTALSRVTFIPDAQYRHEWVIETKHPPGTPTPRMRNTGWLRLLAQRLDPVSGAWDLYIQRNILLWHASAGNWGGPAPFYVNESRGGAETYPGNDPGLQLIATKADTLLLWFMVETYVESDQGPVCLNKLEASVPLMWVWDDPLT